MPVSIKILICTATFMWLLNFVQRSLFFIRLATPAVRQGRKATGLILLSKTAELQLLQGNK